MDERPNVLKVRSIVAVGAAALLLAVAAALPADASVAAPASVVPADGQWAQQPVAPGPVPASPSGVLGYDPLSGWFVSIDLGAPEVVWWFNPSTGRWLPVPSKGTPPPHASFSFGRHAAWDPVGRRFLLFGPGATYGDVDVYTYTVSSNTWTKVTTHSGPVEALSAGVVWDTYAHRLLVFGGCYGFDGCSVSNAILSFDPASTTWAVLSTSGPAPRADATTVWDATDNQLVVFGGQAGGLFGGLYNDVWTWSSVTQTWAQQALTNPTGSGLPSPRSGATGVWDPVHRQVLVYGGYPASDELWAIRPATHAIVPLARTTPWPPGGSATGAWDPTLGSMRLLTGDPSSATGTQMWAYRPAAPVIGGGGFRITSAPSSVPLSWDPGDSQSGYRIVRRTATTTTVIGSTLPATATSAVDPSPPATGAVCYQLATLGGSDIVATSPLLCATRPVPTVANLAHDLSIGVDRTGHVVLRWAAPTVPDPGFTGYVLVRLQGPEYVFVGTSTQYGDELASGPSCWEVRTHDGTTTVGVTGQVCVVP